MSRIFPGILEKASNGLVIGQRGVIVEWNGARDSSVIYSPVSGFAILPPCIAKNIGDTVVCDIDYGMIFTYGHPNCGTVRVVKDGPNNHEECPGVGDFVEYDAIPLEGGEGKWAAINVRFIGRPLEIVHNYLTNVLQLKVRAVVNRVDAVGYEPTAWLWNDYIGRINVPPLYYNGHTPFDDVFCTVAYHCDNNWRFGGEDIVWRAVNFHPAEDESSASTQCKEISTTDGWVVVSDLNADAMCILRNDSSGQIAYAGWNDFTMDYKILRIGLGTMCRVSAIKQLGNGIPYLRAILVTPVDDHGSPMGCHPLSLLDEVV